VAAGCRGRAGQVHRDRAEVAVESHRFEEGIGHDEMTVGRRVDAVAAADVIV